MQTIQETTELLETASAFVNSTGSHIYLTGKAGTGKTTFLRNLHQSTHKRFVIVAPTGIAALNAGGSTIHSMFQLPLGTFLPDRNPSGEFSTELNLYTQNSLSRKHPLSSGKKQVLRSIDLLIIDEVSMLRADVLDAIDYRMRSVRGNFSKAFGGVQVLMIGDLFQLPPIVKDHEWSLLNRYYHSAYFFEAKALQSEGFVFIELEKVYRQSDNTFIHLLNNLRINQVTAADIELLNKHYKTNIEDHTGLVTLTTHNYRAEEINNLQLQQLDSEKNIFEALVEDDFPESMYPITARLELKIGAQIMFVRNDSSNGFYYNGTLGVVNELHHDLVKVKLIENQKIIEVSRAVWENKRYKVNKNSRELDEEVMGTFSQFPIKLAWAVTVHKSQGLTFDRAIIDVGKAFAPGQVYVALSRLRSLDGLILKTPIDPNVINNDSLVVEFSKTRHPNERLHSLLAEKKNYYIQELIANIFEFNSVLKEILFHIREGITENEFADKSMKPTLVVIAEALQSEADNTIKFKQQLLSLLQEGNTLILAERVNKGSKYYLTFLEQHISTLLLHMKTVKEYRPSNAYMQSLDEVDQLLMKKYDDIAKSIIIIEGLIANKSTIDVSAIEIRRESLRIQWLEKAKSLQTTSSMKNSLTKKSQKRINALPAKKSKRAEKAPALSSVEQSLLLFRNGQTINEIAETRNLASGTIESHIIRAINDNLLQLHEFVSPKEIDMIQSAHLLDPKGGMKPIYARFGGTISYSKIRAVLDSLVRNTDQKYNVNP